MAVNLTNDEQTDHFGQRRRGKLELKGVKNKLLNFIG